MTHNLDRDKLTPKSESTGKQLAVTRKYSYVLISISLLSGLYAISLYNYLLFHSLAEIFSIVVACGIFVVAWNSRRFADSDYFLLLGIAYLFVGGLDLFHTLAYKGMNVFPESNTNLPTQLWIATRYLEALSLLAAALLLGRRLKANLIFPAYAGVSCFLLATIFYWRVFPDCFVEGTGLTPFKKISEYVISLILVASIFAIYRKRGDFNAPVFKLLVASAVVTICSELAFTLYAHAYGLSNLLGHFLKIASFYLIYEAVIVTGLREPHNILFRRLKESEARYRSLSESLEETVKKKVGELRQAESMAAIGRMVSVVAHEVRNPLQIIKMGAEVMQKKEGKEGNTEEILEEITYGINVLDNIVGDLLDYSRPVQLQYSSQSIRGLVKRALKTLDHKLRNITVHVELEQENRPVQVDSTRFQEVLLNLISNAAEAMPQGGNLRIQSSFPEADGRDFLEISISDTGAGFDKENLKRIYEPFFTTKTEGIGLGIPICRKIIEAHNGTMKISSRPSQGTTVEIRLPASAPGLRNGGS